MKIVFISLPGHFFGNVPDTSKDKYLSLKGFMHLHKPTKAQILSWILRILTPDQQSQVVHAEP
jgi:hypothetical protein